MYPNDQLDNWQSGQGLWAHVPAEDWNDWRWQLKNRLTKLEHVEKHMELTPEEREGLEFAEHKLAFAVTPYFFNLIDRSDPSCPIRQQVIPRGAEMNTAPEELLDPVGEENTSPVPGIVHRYPDRVLFLATDRCAAYCRYCTRSRMVSNALEYNFHPNYERAIQYIEQHSEIRDVLLSGGDPLLLSDDKLAKLLERLHAIPHVEFVRIGSRIPVFLPQRITPRLQEVFREHGPVWISLHVNHWKECTIDLKEACEKLAFSGVVMGTQTVLLKNINDNADIIKSMIHRLLMMRVRPYYLYQCDLITGSRHFRTDPRKGIEIIEKLRGNTSGYAIPQFVIDAPGGGGKIPVNPEYIVETNDNEIVLRNFQGEIYKYPLPVDDQEAVSERERTATLAPC